MNRRILRMTLALVPAAALAGADGPFPDSIVLTNAALRAEIVPAWAGRLMSFGRPGGPNALWTWPEAARFTVDENGRPVWRNIGGEKTWVGSQDKGWRAFTGKAWPPPAWFDSMPMDVIECGPTGAVLRTGVHRAGDWAIRLERSFALCGDRLLVRQRLLPESVGDLGPKALPDDDRRLWSVAQVPRPDRILLHFAGEGRNVRNGTIPEPVPTAHPGWASIDVAGMADDGKLEADGDRLAAPLADGSGWLVLTQTAPARHLAAFETPGRAMVFVSKPDALPSPYAELEFAAYGPDAEQTVEFRIADDPFGPDPATAWRMDPLGWREDGAAFESRSSGFAFADAAPWREVEIRARVTPRSCEGDSYGTAGVAVYASARDFWCLSLVRAPEPPLVTRHSSLVTGREGGTAAFPPYAPVGPETGIRGQATGFFHIETIDGLDWAIDPVGRAVPLTGIDHVKWVGFSCEKLGGYRAYLEHNKKAYPSREAWAEETAARLHDWGFDLLAAGCDVELLGGRGLAHADNLALSDRFTFADEEWWIAPNLHSPCTAFPNVFHPDFERACEWAAETLCAPGRDDPWLVGRFIDNELAWWGRSADRATGLFDLAMQLPDSHTAKRALRDYVAGRPVTREIKLGFLRLAAERYFVATTAAIRKADPNHLVLGCRFAGLTGAHDVVWEVAGKYCDVVTFNCYPWADIDRGIVLTAKGGDPIVAEFRHRHDLCGKPMLVTEWSFPALDTGRPCYHGAGQRFHTQAERAKATELFARTMLAEPYFLGYDYFMWLDQPALGLNHWFPEDSNYGLVNEEGKPYELVTSMFARLHRDVAALRTATSDERRVTSDESEPAPAPSERERFFAEAAILANAANLANGVNGVNDANDANDANAVGFRQEADGSWSLSNSLVRLSGRIGGAFMADEIAFDGKPAGRFRALLQRTDGDTTLWTDTERVTDVAFALDEATGIGTVTVRAEGGAADTGEKTGAGGVAGPAAFAVTARLSLAPGRGDVLAEIVSVENLTAAPLHVERVFMRPYAVEPRPQECASVPKLWKGPLEDWWLLSDGRRFGLSTRDESAHAVSLWIKDGGAQHPDARFGSPFDLASGATWTPPSPMGALLVSSPPAGDGP